MRNPAHLQKKRRLRRRDASKYLESEWGIIRSEKTLAKEHCLKVGPMVAAYDGRSPLYEEDALDAYARSKLTPVAA